MKNINKTKDNICIILAGIELIICTIGFFLEKDKSNKINYITLILSWLIILSDNFEIKSLKGRLRRNGK